MGFEGSDWLYGGDGNDELWGGDDADYLSDTSGRDSLFGEDGDDTLDTKWYSEGTWANNDTQPDYVDGGYGWNIASAKGIDTVVDAYLY
jgi:Ca2+-binding RTX toxin-like protein